jgi:prolyl 4-hydroxylase
MADILVKEHNGILLDEDIKLIFLKDFIPDHICEHIVGLAYDLFFKQSQTALGIDKSRTSHSCYIPKSHDNVIKKLEEKIAKITNKPVIKVEQLQVVKYEVGEYFKPHYDWLSDEYMKSYNLTQRQYTFFVYLNTVDGGGETDFPQLNLSFKPEKCCALFWQNCDDSQKGHIKSFHQGKPPTKDIKFGLNIWVSF